MKAISVMSISMAAALVAVGMPASGDEASPKVPLDRIQQISPETAQSGAVAADEARIYMAQLKRCEGLPDTQREACVEMARKRLGQL